MIGDRSEDRKICQVLDAQQLAQLAKFFRDILRMLCVFIGAFANIPEKHFALRAIFQRNQAKIKKREQLFAMFEGVVIILAIVLDGDCFAQFAQLNDYLWIILIDFYGRDVFDDCLDLFEHVGDQNRVIGGKKAARLLDDRRMRHVLVIADLFDGVNDVIGKLLRVVVR